MIDRNMDKDETTAHDADEIKKDESITQETEVTESAVDTQVEVQTDQVVVKKKGGGFSLLLSVLALGLAAYVFYLQWQQQPTSGSSNEINELKQELNQLKNSVESIAADTAKNTNAYANINRTISEQGIKLTEIQNQGPESVSTEVQAFDNTTNEYELRQLTQKLNAQQATITQLQTELASQLNEKSSIASEELLLDQDIIQKAAAAQTMIHVQMLVDNQNISAAIDTLERFLLVTTLDNNWKSKIGRLANALKNVNQVDLVALRKQLDVVEKKVDDLELETESQTEDGSWYDRFISVKKISADANVESSIALVEIKTALKRTLYEAKLFLSLQDQNGWQNSLIQLNDMVAQKLPKQDQLKTQIQNLANQAVVNDVPEAFDTEAIISELKGLR